MNELRCKRCSLNIHAEDVHADLGIAKCRACHAVMDLLSREPAGGPPERPASRAEVAIPKRFKVEQQGSTLSIEWRWFTLAAIFLIFFCCFWDGFLVLWYGLSFSSGEAPAMMLLFPLIHVAIGAGLSWYTLALLINRTRLEVGSGMLRVRHSPLPWPGNRELSATSIEQLYCVEVVHRGKNGTSYTYDLMAVLRTGTKPLKLIGRLEKPEQALFLEQRIESFLGIEDRPVSGELRKGA
ncbi:MAG: hypothetical protein HY901_31735 [Deltaproteobacteria bacterium]|nr:hypothetical protein [Deltaproteobacteria bacterium]